MRNLLNKIVKKPVTFILVTITALGAYLAQAFVYAHQLPSRVDEGSFLIKGYYYVTGVYQPFQEYGPWTNNMPLAYYIPGLAQALVGPGLRTGRYFAIFLSLLMLLALWLLARRLKGKWWALAILVWFALNPALIQIYVQAVSQVIAACLLAWSLFFIIGEGRSLRDIALGALFASLAILTRQNMIFLLPFVVIYAWHLHSRRAGLLALLCAGLPLVLMHAIFYPHILTLWSAWLPGFIKDAFGLRLAGGGTQSWAPVVTLLTRVTSFFTTVRYYFIPLLGVTLCLLFLPIKKAWESAHERLSVLYLGAFFMVMFLMHAWASLSKNYCVYCFPNYLAFFLPPGLALAVIGLANLGALKPKLSGWWAALLLFIMLPGTFLGSLETVGRWVMGLAAPRLKGGQVLPGSIELWKLFSNRFGFSYDELLPWIATACGMAVAALLWALVRSFYLLARKHRALQWGNLLVSGLVILALALMPTPLLARAPQENTCGGDVIAAYEAVGAHLDKLIPAGSSVYWAAGSVVTPLLYIPDARTYPPLLNGVYSKRVGGERDLLEKAGYYNNDSVKAWRASADFIINSNRNMVGTWKEFLLPEDFDEYKRSPALDPCNPQSFLRVFKAKR